MGASPSTLRIADHTLTRCEEGSLDVEATLFSVTLGARVTTSAGEARARLARSGLTTALAKQALGAIDREALASYARADCVRAVIDRLGPCEVFEGRAYDRAAQAYEGTWFDLRAMAYDLRVRSAGLVLQGLYFVGLLDELAPATPITLENGSGGEAARMAFLKPRAVIGALSELRPRPPRARWDEEDTVRAELARSLRDRWSTGATPPARLRHVAIEQALAEIDKPTRGPLANLELWTIDRQLAARDGRGALERIQAYARSHGGDTAATRYLRAHLALVEGVEPPRRIAEDLLDEGRSGAPFHELELLKARAWMAAGVWTYARHFARGLVDDPNVPDAVSLGAYEIVEAANARGVGSGPPGSIQPSSGPPSSRQPAGPPESAAPSTVTMGSAVSLSSAMLGDGPPPSTERNIPRMSAEASPPSRPIEPVKIASVTAAPIYVLTGSAIEPAPSSLNLPVDYDDPVSEPPAAISAPSEVPPPMSPRIARMPAERPAEAVEVLEREAPSDASPPTRASSHHYEATSADVHEAPPVFAEPLPREPRIPLDRGHMTDRPPPMEATQPMHPRPALSDLPGLPAITVMAHTPARYMAEEVETLSLPQGLTDRHLPEGVAARNGNEVRIVSTRLARLLGREYREMYGVQLKTDAQAVEWMQRHLVTRWADAALAGPEAAWDVRRHGALLSEILARTLGAEWVDVAPTEIGYWAMFVPPRTRTWPFGRVYRFLTLGHREKDLVSYYLDLVARARHG